jgi:hypothetical protein
MITDAMIIMMPVTRMALAAIPILTHFAGAIRLLQRWSKKEPGLLFCFLSWPALGGRRAAGRLLTRLGGPAGPWPHSFHVSDSQLANPLSDSIGVLAISFGL